MSAPVQGFMVVASELGPHVIAANRRYAELRGGVVDDDEVLVVAAERGYGRPRRRCVAALVDRSGATPRPAVRSEFVRTVAPHANRRAALGLALVGLLIGGVIQLLTATPDTREAPSEDSRASVVFSNAQTGTCLSWPADSPDKPSFVQCRDDHMFEVAKAVDMTNFGEPCQAAVRQYLGRRYDPNSKFTISVLWAGDAVAASRPVTETCLCGLQLLGAGGQADPVQGPSRRARPVQGMAGRHVPGTRPGHQQVERAPRGLRHCPRRRDHRLREPGRPVPRRHADRAPSRTRSSGMGAPVPPRPTSPPLRCRPRAWC